MSHSNSSKRLIKQPVLLWTLSIFVLAASILICTVPLDFYQQLLFALFSLGFSLLIRPEPEDPSRFRRIVLIAISALATGRYLYWRIFESMGWFGSNLDLSTADYFFSFGLLMAEMYAWMVLYLGYFQTIWPLKRQVEPLPDDRSLWPNVDVLIPTYNEPLHVVAPSILAAKNLDWPSDKLNIYVLDDGCREEFRQFSLDAGVNYIERESSEGAKAGNINNALAQTQGDLVAIFDCDHSPVRSFLTKTAGWFLKNENLGLLQTPHLFFSPDPVERNLEIFRSVPNEGQLFYGLVQDGNDLWNSTFFCGSCAVLRRDALEEIGGIATDTVTEDAHTSLLMHRAKWDSAYLNLPLAAGLATERLSAHVGQRIRWARGMSQILRMDNPFLGKGLKLSQRLSYFNAMFHFFFSLPRIIFLTAPLAFLLLEAHVIQAAAAMIAVYALPHIVQSHITNSSLQGKYRHSFWAEVYETILATHIFWPTIKALFNPRHGKFNVTDKGGVIDKDYFDWDTAMPLFFILLLNIAGFIVGIGRLLWWNVHEADTVIMTLCWTGYNLVILGAALAVARERKQLRQTVRIPRSERVEIMSIGAHQHPIHGHTTDLSIVNASLVMDQAPGVEVGEEIHIRLYEGNRFYTFPCQVSSVNERHVGISFSELDASQLAKLVYFTHSQDHAWDEWYGNCTTSRTMKSFFEVVRYGFIGLKKTLFGDKSLPDKDRMGYSVSGWALVFLVVLYGVFFAPKSAQAAITPGTAVESSSIERNISFREMGADTPIALSGMRPQWGLHFRLRQDELVEAATLKIQYSIPTELNFDFKALEIRLNGETLESLDIVNDTPVGEYEKDIPINPLVIGEANTLSFHLMAKDEDEACRNPSTALINNLSKLELSTHQIRLADDLSLLPLPFLDVYSRKPQEIVMLVPEVELSAQRLEAMGMIASWFGSQSRETRLEFPIKNDSLPAEHTVVFATPQTIPASLAQYRFFGAGVAIAPNPVAPDKKLLIISGENDDQLKHAAKALASGQLTLTGQQQNNITDFTLPEREAYDAPRWLRTDKRIFFREMTSPENLVSRGYAASPVQLIFRLPPDLFSWKGDGIPLTIHSHLSEGNISRDSSLDINLNGTPLKRVHYFDENNRPLAKYDLGQLLKQPAGNLSQTSRGELRGTHEIYAQMEQTSNNNHLQMYFNIRPEEDRPDYCQAVFGNTVSGTIDGNSSIDLTGFHHYARMPDLTLFVSHGFPFTRMADLSETAVIVPDKNSHASVEALLTLMARFGEQTGVAATGITVYTNAHIGDINDKDLLLLGTARNQPLFNRWAAHMPIAPEDNGYQWQVRNLSMFEKLSSWRNVNEKQSNLLRVDHLLASSNENLETVFGFQSPHNRHKSVVALASTTPYGLTDVAQAINDPERNFDIKGDLAIIQQEDIRHYEIAPGYFTGRLPLWSGLRWQLSNNMFYMLTLFLATVFIGSFLTYLVMKDKARRRLNEESHAH